MNDVTTRSIPGWLANVVQEFELNGKLLVTVDEIQQVRPELDRAVVRQGVAQLIHRGWLRPTDVRGSYEFIPGAAAGPFPSGDPWLVLRAELERWPKQFHVGANSAAWLLGYAQRSPNRHVVVTTSDSHVPRPLRAHYQVLRTKPAPAHGTVDGLPVPTPPELFVEIAQLAPRLHLDAARGWLCRLLHDTSSDDIVRLLRDRGHATRARAGYLAEVCQVDVLASAIATLGPTGEGPFFTGPRHTDATFSARWRVYDTGRAGGT